MIRIRTLVAAPLAAALADAAPLMAQAVAAGESAGPAATADVGGRSEVFVGSALESYLRYLQTVRVVRPYPWSLRSLSQRELDALLPDTASHPWQHRYDLRARAAGRAPDLALDYVRPSLTLRYNSGFAYGSNDGPVWAGRGLTTAVQGGFAARWRSVTLTLAPIAFRAENAAFPLADNGAAGDLRYGDLAFPLSVDRPRRFGDAAYARIDPGESTLRVDAFGAAVGVSTASQGWGPADRYPSVLGNNAGGYPHAFLGTALPVDLWLVRLHARAVWGVLGQSRFSPVTGTREFTSTAQPGTRRFTSGLVVVVQPRGVPWVELGASRFYHTPWRRNGPVARDFLLPVQSLFKERVASRDVISADPSDNSDFDNQLGSVFTRVVLPGSGYELFGELLRDDHNYDLRDLVLEPAQNAGYTLGVRKAQLRGGGRMRALRAELTSHEPQQLAIGRAQGTIYAHAFLRQGHTSRGQLLGADAGVGSGAAATVAAEFYSPRGRWTAEWTRTQRQTRSRRDDNGLTPPALAADARARDVLHALTVERRLFVGGVDLTASTSAVLGFNHDLLRDRFNANVTLGARYSF